MVNNKRTTILGVAAAICVVFFWSGWIVISRLGVTHHLTIYDLTALRYGVGAAVALPYIIWSRAWHGLTPLRTIVLSLTAIVLFAVFMVASRVWSIGPGQVIFSATIVSAVIYIPIWWLWLDSNLAAAPRSEILLQGAYQGLVPSILGISCLAIAIRHIGPRATSVFISSVPVVAALAAIPILNELPGRPAWIGMTIVTAGILLALGIIGTPEQTKTAEGSQ